MSAAVRCLTLILVGWAGARAAMLDVLPGAELFELGRSEARSVRPAAMFPPLEPTVPLDARWSSSSTPQPSAPAAMPIQPVAVPFYVPVYRYADYPVSRPSLGAAPVYNSAVPDLREWPVSRFAAAALPPSSVAASTAALPALPPPGEPPKFDRLQLTAWTLLRGKESIGAAPRSLASGGTLGGSQAGARLTYRFSPELAASLRTTSAVGTSQSEVAAGVRFTPLRSIPLSITAERRQAIGDYGGRSAFALFAEGGIYGQSLWGLDLDGYAQAGVVGIAERALLADGAFTLTGPVYRQFSAGFGLWGGIQPGVRRIDAGPRVSYRVRPNVRVHVDWRQKLAGSAVPRSGPAVTLAADF